MSRNVTRAQFLQRVAGAGVAAGLAGVYGGRFFGNGGAATLAEGGEVRSFVSHPQLHPPRLTVLRAEPGIARGLLFLAPSEGPGQRGVMIVDDAGEPVWFHATGAPAMNFRPAVYRGKPVLTWWQGSTAHGLGDGTHVIVDQSYRRIAQFPAGGGRPADLHEFLVTPENTALITSYANADADLTALGGKRSDRVVGGIMQELELPSGRVLFEWNSLDHVAVAESHARYRTPFDYFHINSIERDADGNYLVSARNTWAVYKLDGRTGRVLWRLGGKKSDFAMGRGTRFAWQHDARSHQGGKVISLFDDGARPQVEPQSRGLVIALDSKRMRATLKRAYTHHPSVVAVALGSLQVLPNDDVLVGWGTQPYISEYSSSGRLVFDARLPAGGQNYRARREPWVGRPAEHPRLVVSGSSAFASWNGATEVAAWRLRTGSTRARLAAGARTPRSGFETRLNLPRGRGYVSAQALDRHGRVLATTHTVPF